MSKHVLDVESPNLISSGPSFWKLKPLSGWSIWGDETPQSIIAPSNDEFEKKLETSEKFALIKLKLEFLISEADFSDSWSKSKDVSFPVDSKERIFLEWPPLPKVQST